MRTSSAKQAVSGCRLSLNRVLRYPEKEISQMEPSEQQVFLAEYGLAQSGIARVAAAAYQLLNLVSFFTVGEDEVRA